MALPLFAPAPDGSRPMLERISWRTDVQVGTDGTEQRTQLRTVPWFEYEWQGLILPPADASGTPWEGALYSALMRSGEGSHPHVRIPLFPHAVLIGATPSRGVDVGSPVLTLSAKGEEVNEFSPEAVIKVPTAEALLSVDRLTTWESSAYATCRVHARCLNHREVGSNPSPSLTAAALATAGQVLRHDWTSPVEETSALDVLRRETWHAFSEKARYEKRRITLDVVAPSDSAIAALRRFLFACRGRLNGFVWTPPVPGLAGVWRLDLDVVEIAYITCTFAQTQLTFSRIV